MEKSLYLNEFIIDSEENTDTTKYYDVSPMYTDIYKCPYCGCHYVIKDGTYRRIIRDIPLNGRYVVIRLSSHLYKCTRCKKPVRMQFESVSERARLTSRLKSAILQEYDKVHNAYKVADTYGVSEGLVRKMVKARENDQ